MEPWVWGIVISVALALLGVLWKLVSLSIERVERRLDTHIAEDVKVHERVVRLETRGETDAKEITELRERTRGMKHDIMNEVTKTMLGWYNDIIERLLRLLKP